MALPSIPGVVRAAVLGKTDGGGNFVNVWHWRYAGGASAPGTVEIDSLHSVFTRIYSGTAYTTGVPWFGICTAGVSLTNVVYTVLDGQALAYEKAASGTGLTSGPPLPPEVALCLTLRTQFRGRRYRGRIYLPASTTGGSVYTSSGQLSSGAQTNLLTQINGVFSAAAALQWKPVVASYGKSLVKDPNDKYDKIEVTWAPFATDIATVTTNGVFDVQRRRKA